MGIYAIDKSKNELSMKSILRRQVMLLTGAQAELDGDWQLNKRNVRANMAQKVHSGRTKMPTQLTEGSDVALEIPDKGTTKSEP
ncbi:hypothetical protein QJS10_CPB11g00870 [Acorus calamus]|uniref:Uncharacterized protein n=1 Tax=Acorus calamus TaxID=4465 RepID=A0AAV9DS51_ACOCL|nr:hypothetical protein QJS10_CPB11g00870 [Acorus calamus]